jgi:hypothetical protein
MNVLFPVPRGADFIFLGSSDCKRVDPLDKPSREENNAAKAQMEEPP